MVNEAENEAENAKIDPFRVRAAEIAASLDNRLLAAQVLVCGTDGKGSLPSHMKTLFSDCPAGAVILFKYNLDTDNEAIRALVTEIVSLIKDESALPPFIAVDHEGGTVNRFSNAVAALPAASSYWALYLENIKGLTLEEEKIVAKERVLAKIEADSLRAGREINGLGINLNFAPVAEYLSKFNGIFLQSRSYGPDPVFTAEAAAAFTRGMEQAGVLCVIKHFPVSVGRDPHYAASVINNDKAFLDELVYPFAFLIEQGARALMAAHTLAKGVDEEKIASLSPIVMNDWLRGELGFEGIIISDDFSMSAARSADAQSADASGNYSSEEAAVLSVAAGADMVLVWQPDIIRTHRALVSALESGQLPRERLESAASRVIYEKLKMGLLDGEGLTK